MDYTLLESHRQHFRENYNLAKLALQDGKERKAKAYFSHALEHCQYVIENSGDIEERKHYKTLREKCRMLIAKSCDSLNTTGMDIDNANDEKSDKVKTEEETDPSIKVINPEVISLEEALKQLDELEGLDAVKQNVHSWVDQIKVFKLRKSRGITVPEMSYHMVFTGNPGTGKTTIARLLSQIYRALGIVKKGQCVETDRSGLVAGYVGQTALKTQTVIQQALGGVLFIDEAYMLSNGSSNDFGQESIDTLLKAMEDNRNQLVVIVAGYEDLMEKFIESNPGLKSRFKNFIHFTDYTGEQLLNILLGLCKKNQYTLSQEAKNCLYKYFVDLYENRDSNFANGRNVRNLFEKIVTQQSRRIATLYNPDNKIITEIREEDLPFNK